MILYANKRKENHSWSVLACYDILFFFSGDVLWRLHRIETRNMRFKMVRRNQNEKRKKWRINRLKKLPNDNTYKGQTETDTDKTDRTKQENASYDMYFFYIKQKNKRFLDIQKCNTCRKPVE